MYSVAGSEHEDNGRARVCSLGPKPQKAICERDTTAKVMPQKTYHANNVARGDKHLFANQRGIYIGD